MIDFTLLQKSRLFDGFSSAECAQLAAAMESRHFGPGQAIVEEGHAPDHLYLVQAGAVRVTRRFCGRELTVATLHTGDPFGEMAPVDAQPPSATLLADGPCQIAPLRPPHPGPGRGGRRLRSPPRPGRLPGLPRRRMVGRSRRAAGVGRGPCIASGR